MTRRNAFKRTRINLCHAVLAVAVACCLPALSASAQATGSHVDYNIPPGDLASTIDEFNRQSGLQILYKPDLLAGKRGDGIAGTLSGEQALTRLLEGSGVQWERVNGTTYVLRASAKAIRKVPAKAESKEPRKKGEAGVVQELETMVVVGSRLGSSPYDTMSLAKVIEREEIERSGASSIAQVLSYLPEVSVNNSGDSSTGTVGASLSGKEVGFSTVQLRGLPQGTTLILINGRRAGGSASGYDSDLFDLSTIPLAMVDRIEVLPMGSSAIYGGDGLAGVVNIVLRRDAEGLEISSRFMDADGYNESNAGVTFGKTWSRGRIMATGTWRKTGALHTTERSITADSDFRRFGGADTRTPYAYPGNVSSLDGCGTRGEYGYGWDCYFIPVPDRGSLPGLDSANAVVPGGQDGQNLATGDFSATQGQTNLQTGHSHLVSPTTQYGLALNGSFDLGDHTELFAEWNLSRRKVDAKQLPLLIANGEYGSAGAIVSAANPFNPFGVDVGIDYRFENTGIFLEYSQTYWRGLIGARQSGERFNWEVTAWQSREWSDTGSVGYFKSSLVQARLDATDPGQALNVFTGDGTAPGSPEMLRGMLETVQDGFSTKVQGVNAFVRASFKVPAGTAQGLLGGEFERTSLDWKPWASSYVPVNGRDDRRAIFGEARVPVLSAAAGDRDLLVVNSALRHESTGRSQGSALTKAFGLEYRPTSSISVRANYGTAYKPINLFSSAHEPSTLHTSVADPLFGGEWFYVPMIYYGGAPAGLKPETSETLNLALIYSPGPATRVSVSHWQSKLRNRFAGVRAGTILEHETDFPGRVVRDPRTNQILLVDARPVNIAATDNAGVDILAESGWKAGSSEITGSLAASYVYRYDERLTATTDVEDNVARWSWSGWAPRWKITPRIGWQSGDDFGATLTGRYVGKYQDPTPLDSGDHAGTFQNLGNFWQFDLNADLDISRLLPARFSSVDRARVVFGAVNLLNRLPDYCNSCANMGWTGYDPMQYDILGRRVYAELKVSF